MEEIIKFRETINAAYTSKGESILIGKAIFRGEVLKEAGVNIPLRTLNRHGLIAGATGTGKTKTLQLMAEQLSHHGVPVLLLDIKGDLSGLAAKGTAGNAIMERSRLMGMEFEGASFPVELLSLSGRDAVQVRATVSEFGPVLLSKILDLNDTQAGIISVIFKFCDDQVLPLLDLKDLIRVLQYIGNEGKASMEQSYGKISSTTTGTILRKVVELQQQGADAFFGEKSFEIEDLMRLSPDGRGYISILRATDIQEQPRLFSTFMLQMLAELYSNTPEIGDPEKPRLVMFIDEAHLIFKEASKELLDQIEIIVKLIRSKGIGIIFCTQNPMDIPPSVLGQLGLKIQHALRAFTAADRKAIRQTAENYPLSGYYDTEKLITGLGIGEALVTALSEKGTPTELVHAMLCAPKSRMGILTDDEMKNLAATSALMPKYGKAMDRDSAFEMLNARLHGTDSSPEPAGKAKTASEPAGKDPIEKMLDNPLTKSMMRTAGSIIARTLFGIAVNKRRK